MKKRLFELHKSQPLRVAYESFIALLLFTYIIVLMQDTFGDQLTPDQQPIFTNEQVLLMDRILILFFVIEYVIRLSFAKNKWQFVRKNWFDLIAMIPFDQYFRIARFMRILRLIRLIRLSFILSGLIKNKDIRMSFIIVGLIMFWGGTGFYYIEHEVNPNISSYMDAIWWVVVTTTTVGYGDISPVTLGGRIIAVVLMFTGIGLIGSFTAGIASEFLDHLNRSKQKPQANENKIRTNTIEYIQEQVVQVDKLSDEEYQQLIRLISSLRAPKQEKDPS
ncbi:potassium channel family protein [Hazenella sp. IB182357]|uniref:Potassium channel family protein n=1 Tax=Polycladospora coralii TaxID=2771432 RepID=A0A926N5Z5_9BACL|nr:potassium channel family protein [Polycladospora coralii]MBD1372259.1 potassium channel family protein [Polycladospora coralii]MBS7530758.1 potassium channel family protein [Polycladospora coralii]